MKSPIPRSSAPALNAQTTPAPINRPPTHPDAAAAETDADGAHKHDGAEQERERAFKAFKLMRLIDGTESALKRGVDHWNDRPHHFWSAPLVDSLYSKGYPGTHASSRSVNDHGHSCRTDDPHPTATAAAFLDTLSMHATLPHNVQEITESTMRLFMSSAQKLPAGFEWAFVDPYNDAQCREIQQLLQDQYSDDRRFPIQTQYNLAYVHWALRRVDQGTTGLAIRTDKTKRLVGLICGITVDLRHGDCTTTVTEINFLCVHEKLRSKGLATVLIKESMRLGVTTNRRQAIYSSTAMLPGAICRTRPYHRPLNPRKLTECSFAPRPSTEALQCMIVDYGLEEEPLIKGTREMRKEDAREVGRLLNGFMARYKVARVFEPGVVVDTFLKCANEGEQGQESGEERVIWSCVVQDTISDKITDFVSFYSRPSDCAAWGKVARLNLAHLYYCATDVTGIDTDETTSKTGTGPTANHRHDRRGEQALAERLNALVHDALILARNAGFDAMMAPSSMDNTLFLIRQKFQPMDSYLVRVSLLTATLCISVTHCTDIFPAHGHRISISTASPTIQSMAGIQEHHHDQGPDSDTAWYELPS